MPRPKSKEELWSVGEANYQKLWELIDTLNGEQLQGIFAFEDRDRNVRDVIIHLYEWHNLLLLWINSNIKGNKIPFMPAGYTFKTIALFNQEIWKKHQTSTYSQAKNLLMNSHVEVLNKINTFTNEELFTKKFYDWTGTTSLGSYCVSATSSHYDWAYKKIKKHIRTL